MTDGDTMSWLWPIVISWAYVGRERRSASRPPSDVWERLKDATTGPTEWARQLEEGVLDEDQLEALMMARAAKDGSRARTSEPDGGPPDWKQGAPRWLLVYLVVMFGAYFAWSTERRMQRVEGHVEQASEPKNGAFARLAAVEQSARQWEQWQVKSDARQAKMEDILEALVIAQAKEDGRDEEIVRRLTRIESAVK